MKHFILLSLIVFCSCNDENSSEFNYENLRFCTLMGAVSELKIDFYKGSSIKEFLAYSINDSEVLYDACSDENNGELSEKGFFYQATIGTNETFMSYFPDGNLRRDFPNSNIINFNLYNRSSCGEELELVYSRNSSIEWTPLYPNGKGCGKEGYSGQVEVTEI